MPKRLQFLDFTPVNKGYPDQPFFFSIEQSRTRGHNVAASVTAPVLPLAPVPASSDTLNAPAPPHPRIPSQLAQTKPRGTGHPAGAHECLRESKATVRLQLPPLCRTTSEGSGAVAFGEKPSLGCRPTVSPGRPSEPVT